MSGIGIPVNHPNRLSHCKRLINHHGLHTAGPVIVIIQFVTYVLLRPVLRIECYYRHRVTVPIPGKRPVNLNIRLRERSEKLVRAQFQAIISSRARHCADMVLYEFPQRDFVFIPALCQRVAHSGAGARKNPVHRIFLIIPVAGR